MVGAYCPHVDMARRLGVACRQARYAANLRALDIAAAAGVSEATISLFERAAGAWSPQTERIVEAYEHQCGLEDGELWRRAVRTPPDR